MKTTSEIKTRWRTSIVFTIVITVLAVFITAEIIDTNGRLISTLWRVNNISWTIQDYNEQFIKTDKETAEIEELFAEREELYNTTGFVGLIARSNAIVKLLAFLIAVAVYIVLFIAWIKGIGYIIQGFKELKQMTKC